MKKFLLILIGLMPLLVLGQGADNTRFNVITMPNYSDSVSRINDTLISHNIRLLALIDSLAKQGDSLNEHNIRLLALVDSIRRHTDSLQAHNSRINAILDSLGNISTVEEDPIYAGDSIELIRWPDTTGNSKIATRWWNSQQAYLTANQTITLSGDVTGSGTTAITATVADDSHNHVISNVDNLQDSITRDYAITKAFNAAGDIILGTGNNTFDRLAIGANGKYLKSNGTTASWEDVAGGSGVPADSLAWKKGTANVYLRDLNDVVSIGSANPYLRLGQKLATNTSAGWGGISLNTWTTASAEGSGLDFNRSKSATIGTQSILADNDMIGYFAFRGSNGTSFYDAAYVIGDVDGTPTAGSYVPGSLSFWTASASAAASERMRITSAGNVGIGTTTPPALLSVSASKSTDTLFHVTNDANTLKDSTFSVFSNGQATMQNSDVINTRKLQNSLADGKALNFDGSNDYVSLGTSTQLDLGTGDGTYFVRFKNDGNDGAYNFLFDVYDATTTDRQFITIIDNGTLRGLFQDNATSVQCSGTTDIGSDSKVHSAAFSITRNSATGLKLYLDGKEELYTDQQNPTSLTGSITSSGTKYIGIYNNGSSYPFKGSIYNFKYFNCALTAAEIKALSEGQSTPYYYTGASNTELVTNGTFETNTSGWTSDGATTFTRNTSSPISGTGDCHWAYSTGTDAKGITSTGISFEMGKMYTLSFTYRKVGVNNPSFRITKNYITGTAVGGTPQVLLSATSNTYYSISFIPTETATGYLHFYGGYVAVDMYVDNVSIKKVGEILSLDPAGMSTATWFDQSGNGIDGTVSGASLYDVPEHVNLNNANFSGNVGIGTTAPDEKFVVYNGSTTGKYTSSGWTHSSDSTMKDSIRDIKNVLGKLKKLQGVKFVWKEDTAKWVTRYDTTGFTVTVRQDTVWKDTTYTIGTATGTTTVTEKIVDEIRQVNDTTYEVTTTQVKDPSFVKHKQLGFIAQSVEKVIPEAVRKGADGKLSIADGQILPIVVEAAKELAAEIDTLNDMTLSTQIITPDSTGIKRSMLAKTMYLSLNKAVTTPAGTKQIANGKIDGQEITLVGMHNTNTLTLRDADNINLSTATIQLKKYQTLTLIWAAPLNTWLEKSRSLN